MKRSRNQQEQALQRGMAVELHKKGLLRQVFSGNDIDRSHEGLSPEAWRIIRMAEAIIQQREIEDLDILLFEYVDAVKRAEGCKCGQCRRRAARITELLDAELLRLTHCLTDEFQDQRLENQMIAADTNRAIQRLKEAKAKQMRQQFDKREKEWLRRSKRIKQLIDKVVAHNDEPNKGLTVEERAEIQELLEAARERRKEWAWKKW